MARRAWAAIALGDDRQYGGNAGYSDEPSRFYRYDSSVNNHKQVSIGDLLFIRDRRRLVGVGVISSIREYDAQKERMRCPTCNTPNIKRRSTKRPQWRCVEGHEFDSPNVESISTRAFEAWYGDSFVPATELVTSEELKAAALRRNDQLSIEEIAPGRLPSRIGDRDAKLHGLITAFLDSRTLPPEVADDTSSQLGRAVYQPTIGDARDLVLRTIKQRRGQGGFREALVRRYGRACMISGCSLLDVFEAAHISAYRGTEDHHPDNGLLLRADLHTLFDLNLIAIHPETLTIHLAHQVTASEYMQYASTSLRLGNAPKPSEQALKMRWAIFESAQRGDTSPMLQFKAALPETTNDLDDVARRLIATGYGKK